MSVSDKEDKSPLKPAQPAQKITIIKNAMKAKETNKIDYGVSGVDESKFSIFFFRSIKVLFMVFYRFKSGTNECASRYF